MVTCGRVFGAHPGLSCLDLHQSLKLVWHREETALDDHVTTASTRSRPFPAGRRRPPANVGLWPSCAASALPSRTPPPATTPFISSAMRRAARPSAQDRTKLAVTLQVIGANVPLAARRRRHSHQPRNCGCSPPSRAASRAAPR